MARIPYPDLRNAPETDELQQQILRERGVTSMPHLYAMLLHSPPVAEGWLNFFTAVRQKCTLSGRTRELIILRIAVLNDADYEFAAHVPVALKEGLSRQQIDAIARWQESTGFSDIDRAVLAYADEMTQKVHVSNDTFAAVATHFGAREMMELTLTAAAYNMVSRFLEATQIDPEPR